MIFDNSSKKYDVLRSYMGNVTFNQFRTTGYRIRIKFIISCLTNQK